MDITRQEFDSLTYTVKNHRHNETDTTKPLEGRVVPLLAGTTVNTNVQFGDIFTLTATASFTMANPTGAFDGKMFIYKIKQDATGSRVITWDTKFRGSTDVALPVLTTTAAYVDYVGFVYDAVVDKFNVLAVSKGYAT